MDKIFNFRLQNLPLSAKSLVIGYLACLSLGYVYALINVGQRVGFLPSQIAMTYYGSTTKQTSNQKKASGEEELNFDEVKEVKVEEVVRPSFKKIIAEGHFHLFGMASFFFGLTLLGLFTNHSEKWKIVMLGSPYIAIIFDHISFMATRFLGPQFAYLTVIAGSVMGITFTILWWAVLSETCKKRTQNV